MVVSNRVMPSICVFPAERERTLLFYSRFQITFPRQVAKFVGGDGNYVRELGNLVPNHMNLVPIRDFKFGAWCA